MKMNNIIMACGAFLFGAAVLSGCGEDENYDVDGIAYTRAFFDRAKSVSEGKVLSTPVGVITSFSEKVLVKTTSPAQVTTKVTVSIDNSLIAVYNAAHGTNYAQLPDGILQLENPILTIPAHASQSADTLKLSIDDRAAASLDNEDGYLAPIVISSVDNGSIRPSSDAAVRYMKVDFMKTTSLINDNPENCLGSVAPIPSLTCIEATNLDPMEFQGLAADSWDAQWNFLSDEEESASFVIDFGAVHKLGGFYIESYVLKNAYVETSTDKAGWTEVGNTSEHKAYENYDPITDENLNEYVLYAPVQARYLRATLTLDSSGWAWNYYKCILSISVYYTD